LAEDIGRRAKRWQLTTHVYIVNDIGENLRSWQLLFGEQQQQLRVLQRDNLIF